MQHNDTYILLKWTWGSFHDKLYVGLHKRLQIKNLTLHIKEGKKKEQIKPQTSWTKEKIKIRAKISGLENRKKRKLEKKINETKRWFFKKNN